MNEENVAIRLKGFIDKMGLSSSQFADQCGIPRPSLSQLLSGRNKKISDVLVGQIHSAFPDLSVLWLLFGEGDMLVSSLSPKEPENASITHPTSLFDGSGAETEPQVSKRQVASAAARSQADAKLEKELAQVKIEIDKLRKTPRKVSQITVYYDDSTFETFYPVGGGRNKG